MLLGSSGGGGAGVFWSAIGAAGGCETLPLLIEGTVDDGGAMVLAVAGTIGRGLTGLPAPDFVVGFVAVFPCSFSFASL